MLNYIWLGLIVLAVILGGCTDRLQEVVDRSFEMAKFAVLETALPLVGIMALWLGMMRLAERAGLIALLARGLRPVLRWLFPEVPAGHPAMGSMLMNIAANMLGLGNAATPLGLRAMKDLETLNLHPGTATNAMCTFLAINTSSVQLIPATAIAILAANRSSNPTAIVGTSILATACAAVSAVAMSKLLARVGVFNIGAESRGLAPDRGLNATATQTSGKEEDSMAANAEPARPLAWCGRLLLTLFGLFFVHLFIRLAFPELVGRSTSYLAMGQSRFVRVVDAISKLSIPFILAFFPLYAVLRRVKAYEEFVEGAKEGFQVALRIIPYLVAIMVAIGMFRAAGGIELISKWLGPLLRAIGFPTELLPLALMRPLSGSGTLGIFAELVKSSGPDSLLARTAGTIYGSTETTFYVLAVYFGAVGIKRTRYAIVAGLTADLVGIIASVIICRLVFG